MQQLLQKKKNTRNPTLFQSVWWIRMFLGLQYKDSIIELKSKKNLDFYYFVFRDLIVTFYLCRLDWCKCTFR